MLFSSHLQIADSRDYLRLITLINRLLLWVGIVKNIIDLKFRIQKIKFKISDGYIKVLNISR